MKTLVITLISILGMILLYSNYNIPDEAVPDAELIDEVKPAITKPLIVPDKLPEVIAPSKEVTGIIEPVKPEDKIKKYNLKKVYFIPNLMEFIKSTGDIDNLSNEQKLRLGKSLQYCGAFPRHDKEAMENMKEDILTAGITKPGDDLFGEKMCVNVPDNLIDESYYMLEELAKDGDMQAALKFYNAVSPELFTVGRANKLSEIDINELWQEHYERAEPLLIDSIYNGSIAAVLALGIQKWSGGIGTEKDYKMAISYFTAIMDVTGRYNLLAQHIEEMSDELTFTEVREAEQFAANLVNHWKSLPEGIWTR